MARAKSAREKLRAGHEPEVKLHQGRKLLIPSPLLIDEAIKRIPEGQVLADRELRDKLAAEHGADECCPLCTGIFWRVAAEAAEEDRAEGKEDITPWWRLTKGGKPNPKLPGGEEEHRRRLSEEGVSLPEGRPKRSKA